MLACCLADPDQYGLPFEDVIITCADKTELHSWLIPQKAPGQAPTMILMHGNASNISTRVAE